MESDVVTLQDIFVARPPDEESSDAGGATRLLAPLQCTGLKPHFLEKLAANGVVLPPSFFESRTTADGSARPSRPTSFDGAFAVTARTARCSPLRPPRSIARLVGRGREPGCASPASTPSGYPARRASTSSRTALRRRRRRLRENGAPGRGLEAVNLGDAKSVVLAIDRSQSMAGASLADAIAARERSSPQAMPPTAIAVVAFGRAGGPAHRLLDLDRPTPTARSRDARRRRAARHRALRRRRRSPPSRSRASQLAGRVIIVLTDGSDVSSHASLDAGGRRRAQRRRVRLSDRDRGPAVRPDARCRRSPRRPAARYTAPASTAALAQIYASIAAELGRTWQRRLRHRRHGPGDAVCAARNASRAPAPPTAPSAVPGASGRRDPRLDRAPAVVRSTRAVRHARHRRSLIGADRARRACS